MKNPEISVIVPVYKVSDYIERSAGSLFDQDFPYAEFIFVDDCTPDDSIEKLERLVEKRKLSDRVTIARHTVNRGLPSARNTGLDIATGKYVINIDSDDWVEPDMLEKMHARITDGDHDIVWSDFYIEKSDHTRYSNQAGDEDPHACLRRILRGQMGGYVWNKMIRRNLFTENGVRFPDGINMWEDVATILRLFWHARSVAYLPPPFARYVNYNTNSYTKQKNPVVHHNMQQAVALLEDFLRANGAGDIADNDLNYLKITVKNSLLSDGDPRDRRKHARQYPEATPFIMSYKTMHIAPRLGLWLASHGMMPVASGIYNMIPPLRRLIRGNDQ